MIILSFMSEPKVKFSWWNDHWMINIDIAELLSLPILNLSSANEWSGRGIKFVRTWQIIVKMVLKLDLPTRKAFHLPPIQLCLPSIPDLIRQHCVSYTIGNDSLACVDIGFRYRGNCCGVEGKTNLKGACHLLWRRSLSSKLDVRKWS